MSHSGFATTRSMSKGLEDIVHSWERCCCVFHIFGKLSLSEAFYWRLMFHHPRNWKIPLRWNLQKKCLVVPFSWLRIILERCTRIWNLIENKLFSANRRNCLMSELNWKRVKKQSWIGLLMWVYHKDPKCQSWMFWSDCHSGQNIVDIEICQMSSQWKNFHFLLWRTNNADELGNLSLKVGKKDEFFMSRRVMHCFFQD